MLDKTPVSVRSNIRSWPFAGVSPSENRLKRMKHLAQHEERQHERNEENETIFGRVVHHEVHQHGNADTCGDEKENTRHSGGLARLLLTEGYQRLSRRQWL